MMDQCLDPYEEQLYKVFSSHDSDHDGSLDRSGLVQLCETLQLQDKSDDLITALLCNRRHLKVTFPQFKDALLQLLGSMQNSHKDDHHADATQPSKVCENHENDREVAPKYVVGTKKYGRRSRPRIDDSPLSPLTNHHGSNGIQRSNSTADHIRPQMKPVRLQRCTSVPSVTSYEETSFISEYSASNMTENCTEEMLRRAWRKLGVGEEGYLNQNELILVFEAIGLDKLTDNVIHHLSNKSDLDINKNISFQDLLEALKKDDIWIHFLEDSCSAVTRRSSFILNSEELQQDKVNIKLGPDGSGFVSCELIAEMWTTAGITSPKLLLKDLGFNTAVNIDVSELASILEKEIKSLSELKIDHSCNPLVALLQAFIALYQAEIKCLKSLYQQVCDEKEKLKFDVSEANNRSTLLAQEVDENVAKLEQKAENQAKLSETRHLEELRQLSVQFSNDKEQLLVGNQDLEEKIKTLEKEESLLRENLQSVQNYLGVVEGENKKLAGMVCELEAAKVNLERQIDELELEKLKVLEIEAVKSGELLDEIGQLKKENCMLKDKNDEMVCQIETLNKEIVISRAQGKPKIEEPINLDGIGLGGKRRNGETTSDEFDYECAISGSPRLGKMRKFHESKEALALDASFIDVDTAAAPCMQHKIALVDSLLRKYYLKLDCNENSEENYTRMLEQLLSHLLSINDDADAINFRTALINQRIHPLGDDITNTKSPRLTKAAEAALPEACPPDYNEDKARISALTADNLALTEKCDNLQQGLNLLRDEYELCEDYWQKKLEEERSFYEQEQSQSTDKLSEVLSRLAEYEEQFIEDGKRLATIDESLLEKQYADMENEYEEYKQRTQCELDEQEALLVSLRLELQCLKCREQSRSDSMEVAVQVDDLKFMNLGYTTLHCEYVPEDEADAVSWPITNSHTANTKRCISPFTIPTPTSSDLARSNPCNTNTTMPLKTKKNRRHVRNLSQPVRNLKRCTSSDSSDNNAASKESEVYPPWSHSDDSVQRLREQNQHLERRCMELQTQLKFSKRLYDQLSKSHSQLYHSCRGELQHVYTKLDQQFRLSNQLHEKLASNDVLVGNLYIENAYLIKNNQRLEQQLQMFTNAKEC